MSSVDIKPPMYFATLEVENIKCFGDKQVLDLRNVDGSISPWTLILGDNGVGKTTLLKCLAWMIPVEETEQESKDGKVVIKPFMDGLENESEYEQLARVGQNVKARVSASLTSGIGIGAIPQDEDIVSHAINIQAQNGKLESIELEYGYLKAFNSPNLYGYSASRHMAFKNFDSSELKENTSNLFSKSGDLYDAEQLLTILDNASIRQNGKGKAADLLKKVKQILVDLLPYIESADNIIINSPLKEDGSTNDILVEVRTPDGKVPLFNLSLGYVTMLSWTVDLALRMLWRNPESDNPLKEPAVVIVDEIDLHLHPKWQRIIRRDLINHFPNTQFICTAHSPFMAQSAENENLCVVNRNDGKVQIENEPSIVQGWRIGQISTSDLIGVSSERSIEVERLVNKRRELLDKDTLTEEESNQLKQLNEKLADLPVLENDDNQKLLEQINNAAKLLNINRG